MEKPQRSCSADAWHMCLIAMNKNTDEVAIKASALAEVVQCHQRHGENVSRDIVVRQRRRKYIVRRHLLWDLVQAHGKQACDKP